MELYFKPEFFANSQYFPYMTINTEGFSANTNQYTEAKKISDVQITSKFKKIRFIPLSGGNLDYESDRWDFKEYCLINDTHAALKFDNVPDPFKDLCKDYILLLILNGGIKVSSLYAEFIQLRPFLRFLYDRGLTSIENIDDSDVEKYLFSKNVSERSFTKHQLTIKKFLQFYDAEHHTEIFTPGMDKLCTRIEGKKLKPLIVANRRKAIPDEYFNKLLALLIKIIDDESESVNNRVYAAMLIIDSQTGLRASELSLLENNSVEEIDIDGEKARMIHYKIIKTAKGNFGYTDNITYINDLSFKAYNLVSTLLDDIRKERNTNYLFCPKGVSIPARSSTYVDFLKRLCIKNHAVLGSTDKKYKDIFDGSTTKSTIIHCWCNDNPNRAPYLENFDDNQEFYYPFVHQFRNTVVTGLLNRGIQLEFIRRYMGHLTEEMTSAYAESYDTKMQENLSVSESALNTIVNGDAKLLGANAGKLTEGIDRWIESNELNVSTNLDEIIHGLEKLIPIRAKRGGFCMKGARIAKGCSVDAKTDEFLCAVGLCPNICHFYFNADESYIDYKEAMATYEYNKENGFTKQADKELSKARYILMNRLAPEMVELDKEISKIGFQEVLKRHPSLEDVLNNIDEIKEAIDGYIEEKLD